MANSRLPDLIPQAQLLPHSDNKNVVSQIRRYNRWLAESGRVLHQPDLTSYRDLLLETLAPAQRPRSPFQHPPQLQSAG